MLNWSVFNSSVAQLMLNLPIRNEYQVVFIVCYTALFEIYFTSVGLTRSYDVTKAHPSCWLKTANQVNRTWLDVITTVYE